MIKYFDITDSKIYKGFITHEDKSEDGLNLYFAIYGNVLKVDGTKTNIYKWSSRENASELDTRSAERYIEQFLAAEVVKDDLIS